MIDHDIGKTFKSARLNRSSEPHLWAVTLYIEFKKRTLGICMALLSLFVTEENCKILWKDNFQKKIKS